MIKINKPFHSPNTDSQIINVKFLILHYTAADLNQTLKIFKNSSQKVSCHFVIDFDGSIYEILPCLNEKPIKAFHSGESFWTNPNQKKYSNFNEISLGIELVNFNGNLFSFTDQQYLALTNLTLKLKNIYPSLMSPHHILGHEHIAGFRGKVDPGFKFDWKLFFTNTYPELHSSKNNYPSRSPVLPDHLRERFEDFVNHLSDREKNWSTLNSLLEKQYRHYLETE